MTNISYLLPGQSSGLLGIKKSHAAYHAIRRSILLREVLPGEALVEQHLAAQMGCSQGTVREALLRLQEDGLVVRRGYQGTVVSHTLLAEAAQMAQIRIQIETAGIREAAGVIGPSEIDELSKLVEQIEEGRQAGEDYLCSELDRELHLRIFQASGLSAMEPILHRCALHMHRYTFGHVGKRDREAPATAEHQAIVAALAAGDADAAASAVASHIESVIDLWSPTLRRAMKDREAAEAAKSSSGRVRP